MYKKLILEVDAMDNGVSEAPVMKYTTNTGLRARIARMNPYPDKPGYTPEAQHSQFRKAMALAEEELAWNIEALLDRLKSYEIVKESFDRRRNFHESGEVLLLLNHCAWKSLLLEIEKENDQAGIVKFVLFS